MEHGLYGRANLVAHTLNNTRIQLEDVGDVADEEVFAQSRDDRVVWLDIVTEPDGRGQGDELLREPEFAP
ncbi:MAG TPA: hypothetical protein VI322_04305 [Candidatus Saccharimonadia bacterium]